MVDTLILILPVPKGSFSCEIVIVIPSCKKEKKEKKGRKYRSFNWETLKKNCIRANATATARS